MPNVIKAFLKIVTNYQTSIQSVTNGNNRANNMGKGLEHYIKEMFVDVGTSDSQERRLEIFQETYSYQGNKNNPPDLILKNSDAIEIKKLESHTTAIALNSSFPKSKLYADSTMITSACRTCETWNEKEMLYAIGNVPKDTNQLKSLWLVYGNCFCADKEIYERIKDTISNGITAITDVEFTQINELGKVKKVDPLGVTDLRIRGMWHIGNPSKILSYLYTHDETKAFQMVCLMKKEKYDTMPKVDRDALEKLNGTKVTVKEVKIQNPNNPVHLMDGKLLIFGV